jgi:hypothetical protein
MTAFLYVYVDNTDATIELPLAQVRVQSRSRSLHHMVTTLQG